MPCDDACCCCFSSAPPQNSKSGKGVMYAKFHNYNNNWDIRLCDAPCEAPCCCCIGCLPCSWCCVQYTMRKRVLEAQQPGSGLQNYQCGQGYLPKCCCGLWNPGRCGCCGCYESSCPTCCLCLEACICPGLVITGSRLLAMDMYQIQPDPCDNRLIRFNNCIQCLACICHILAIVNDSFRDCAAIIDCIADVVFFSTAGCMVAQLNRELIVRKAAGGSPAAPDVIIEEAPKLEGLAEAPKGDVITDRS
ncbi:hypothetical protein CTAYLR_001980 [Chrysophaeum taylorii]|uniref:Uncharacterized protein n=1 Tax=Chrysophaeum taylorii TaxID=2483200 RepID=A0AAD7XLB0_9STRA|nr:hypothetical protein CTAYLR_001980 [Chrysophaeum taylorii]